MRWPSRWNSVLSADALAVPPAVILCGGRGTRIAAIAQGLPKSMLPIAGEPFLARLIDRMSAWGVDRFVLCTGAGADAIARWVDGLGVDRSAIRLMEDRVVGGTLSPVRRAFKALDLEEALIVNGDTMVYGDVGAVVTLPLGPAELCRIGMTPVDDTERFGRLEVEDGRLRAVRRGVAGPGFASNGMIRARVGLFDHATSEMTGIEELVAAAAASGGVTVARAGDQFIDIGTPSDYAALRDGV